VPTRRPCGPSFGERSTAGPDVRRRPTVAALLLLALACPFAAPVPAAAGPAPSTTIADPADTPGVLDLRSVRLAQRLGSLVFTFTTRRPFQVSWLSARARRTVCLEIGPRLRPARAVRLCLTGRRGGYALYRSPVVPGGPRARFVRADVSRPDLYSAAVRFAYADAALGVGRVDWSVSTVWVRGGGCIAAAPCRDAAPDAGRVLSRIDRFRVAGCVAAGASERFSGPAGGRDVALTFDDGPAPSTLAVLRVLRRDGARGTFFEIGRQVAGEAAVARDVLRAGEELGNHTWSHPVLTASNTRAQLGRTQAAIAAAAGFTPCLMRPPYGIAAPEVVATARRMGMLTVQWDVDPKDWARPGAQVIAARVLGAVHPGAIVELHDGGGDRSQTVQALETIVPALRARGYRLVTVSRMLGLRRTYSYQP
jgi:peptidoglycan-N-acetylglucosamine deacetylase